MSPSETALEMAERHVREGEQHLADQREILWWLSQGSEACNFAWEILKQYDEMLALRREDLERLRASGCDITGFRSG